MRDPHRWRTIGLWRLSLAALSLIAWLWVGADHVGVRVALLSFGAVGMVFGGFLASFGHQDVRAKEALARGEDIIARWRVGGGRLATICHAEPAMAVGRGRLRHELIAMTWMQDSWTRCPSAMRERTRARPAP